MKSRIQVSRDTANLLMASGKGKWVTEREGKVHAKGKGKKARPLIVNWNLVCDSPNLSPIVATTGELQTYWLRIRGGSDAASSVGGAGDSSESNDLTKDDEMHNSDMPANNDTGHDMIKDMAVTAKTRRLVEWNSVLLGKLLKHILMRQEGL